MTFGFSTLGCPEMGLAEIVRTAQSRHITEIEIRGMGEHLDAREIPAFSPEALPATRAFLAEAGVRILSLDTSACFHDPAGYDAALEEACAAVEIAAVLGAPFVRVFGNNTGDDPAGAVRRVIRGMKCLADKAAALGVTALLETHGDFRTEKTLSPVTEALGTHPGFGLLWDVLQLYYTAGRDFLPLYCTFLPYIRHVHFKDCTPAPDFALTLPGEGDIPLAAIYRRLREDGYDGCVSLEWERRWHPDFPPVGTALDAMLALLRD